MNVLFDLLSGEKEMAPGGVTGTGRQGEWGIAALGQDALGGQALVAFLPDAG